VRAERHHADSPFDIVDRPVAVPDSRTWQEQALRTWPSQSFVDLADGAGRALAVLHAGIPEYEVSEDQTRSVALTLLRSFGAAGGVADTWTPQPLAQVPGEHEFRYAAHPHAGDCRADRVWREARALAVPLRVVQCTAHRGELPWAGRSFVGLDSEDLVMTALKQSEDRGALVLRCFNPMRRPVRATVSLDRPIAAASGVTLEEQPLAGLPVAGTAVPIAVAPGQIASIRMEVAK